MKREGMVRHGLAAAPGGRGGGGGVPQGISRVGSRRCFRLQDAPAPPRRRGGSPVGPAVLLLAVFFGGGMAGAGSAAHGQTAAGRGQEAGPGPVALVGGEVHTVSGSVLRGGTVVLAGGRIAAVGREVPIPPGARVLDVRGKVVTPGLLDSSTRLGVVEIGSYAGTSDGSSANPRMTAAFQVAEGINPYSTLIPVARVEGITRVVVAPAPEASLLAGMGALVHLGGPKSADMLQKNPVGLWGALGEQGSALSGGARSLALLRLREAFEDARDYDRNRAAYAAGNRREYSLGRLDLEALLRVVRKEIPLVLEVNRAADILMAIRLAEELGVRLVLSGAREGWMVADELSAAQVPVIVRPSANVPSFEALGATFENAARLHRAGVKVVLATFDAHNVRNLKQEAGLAVSYGLPHEAALRAVTLSPAEVWGVAGDIGSLDVGKRGDVVVWSGDPFEMMTSVEHVFIEGREISYETRQKALLEKYRTVGGRPPRR